MMTLNQSFIQTEKSSASGSLEMVLQSQFGIKPEVIFKPYLALKFNFDHIFLMNIVGLAVHSSVLQTEQRRQDDQAQGAVTHSD